MNEPAVTKYGDESPAAPPELRLFSFLVGHWEGTAQAPLPDGKFAEVKLSWIGRYILDGMAIADELHAETADGDYLGITIRHFDPESRAWTVEFLNVKGSFLRRQVNPRSGAVTQDGRTIMVTGRDGDQVTREEYRLSGSDQFTYVLFMSEDGGRTWGEAQYEYRMTRTD